MVYFVGTWLNGNFSLAQWNVHLIDQQQLQRLAQQSKTLAGKSHLKIFELMELLKTEQSNMEASILQLASGGTLGSKGVKQEEKRRKSKKDTGEI